MSILQVDRKPEPHLASVLKSNATLDDRLLRCEMICALNLIMQGMNLDTGDKFQYIPVYDPLFDRT
jgi:hypothetical protein